MAEHYSFESVVGFNRIDVDDIGELDSSDIKHYLDGKGVSCTLEEAALLIHQYDEDNNGRLNYPEFCSLILPSTNDHLRAVAKSREAEYRYIKSAYLSAPVDNALAKLIEEELKYQRAIDEIKRELNARFDFTVRRCFETIDKAYPYNLLDRNEIRSFVKEYYVNLTEEDLDSIIRRCDTDEDQQISETEFKDVVKHKVVNPVATKFLGSFYKPAERKYTRRREALPETKSSTSLKTLYNKWWYTKPYDRDYSRSYLNRSYWRRYSPVRLSERLSPVRYTARPTSLDRRRYYRDYAPFSNYLYPYQERTTLKSLFDESNRRRLSRTRRPISSLTKEDRTPVKDNRVKEETKVLSDPKIRSNFKYSLYDKYRNTYSTPERTKLAGNYAESRTSLKTRFDVADELTEEKKDITPAKRSLGSSTKKSLRTTHTLSAKDEDELLDSLRDLVNLDKDLERARQALAQRPDFTLYDVYRVFDYDNNGNVILDDIIEAFETFGVYPTREEARLFMVRYDLNKDNNLDYEEVCEAFLPKDKATALTLRNRSTKYPNGYYRRLDEFSALTKDALVKVFQIHLDVEKQAEAIRQSHDQAFGFRYEDAFTTLNNWGDDYITKENFADFFKKYGFYATDLELDMLVGRFDKDYDGRVSFEEFYEELFPHSPVKV